MLAWELLGAVVGAGLASGREIASFFGQYGGWGIVGIALSAAVLYALAEGELPAAWRTSWPGKLWQALLTLLLTATGGAMLSGAGHLAALTLPVHGAYWLGMGTTLLLAFFLARRTGDGLAKVSRIMLCAMLVMLLSGFAVSPMRAVAVTDASPMEALCRAVTYGGFNAALQYPILAASGGLSVKSGRRSALMACVGLACVLLLGNALLLRHPALLGEEMPFVRLMREHGKAGYLLSALCMYLASLSTLTACLRGVKGSPLPLAAMLLICLIGFEGVVSSVYPLLGGSCFLMLLAAKLVKIRNSFR